MIETGLVYIYSISPARAFRGCGALIEGGYIATCRHVWPKPVPTGELQSNEPTEVEIEFPFVRDKDISTSRATLADSCEDAEGEVPDLVLLLPGTIPSGVMTLQLATKERFETGAGRAHTYLASRKRYSTVDERIDTEAGPDGLRQFRSDQSQQYFFEKGSSGSPVFLENAQQLTGIIALAELGANAQESHLREAFVVPATTIRAFLVRLHARPVADKRGIRLADWQPILDKLGAQGVAASDIPARLLAFVEEAQKQAAKPVPASNDGADIDAAIAASRAKLGALDTAGALEVLQAKIAGEEQERVRRVVPLLKERAAVERLAFDYDAAKRSLTEVTRLAPDDAGALIDLGDLYLITGPLEEAAKAFRAAEEAARRRGGERDLSVSLSRVGNVQVTQGDLAGALKSYQDSLAIFDRPAKADPGNAGWQRDLSVSIEKVGNVQMAQGELAGALKSYQDSLATRDRLAKSDPGNAGWQRDLSVSYNKIGDVQVDQGELAGALKSYQDSLAIRDRLAKSNPGNAGWQRDQSVAYERIGDVQKAQGDLAGALKSYNDGLAIRDRLAKSDPGNAGWQRNLSVSFNNVGDVQKAQGDLAGALKSYEDGLAIAERLAKSDPGNAGWQRDLSVSYNKIGDVQEEQGDLAGALKSYQDSLAIRERLAKSDPSNAEWQRDLSVSFSKLESAYRASGDNAKALDALRQGQAIMSRMTKLSPDNAVWKRDLTWFDRQIKDLTP